MPAKSWRSIRRSVSLLSSLEGVSEFAAKGEAPPDFDYHCPLGSLPLAFDTTLDTISVNMRGVKTAPLWVADRPTTA